MEEEEPMGQPSMAGRTPRSSKWAVLISAGIVVFSLLLMMLLLLLVVEVDDVVVASN